ncbi:STAS domain-containing protein [Streptomyces sp. NPDC047017]|uniref:STAS domain-containing protein n=1 Tax=Streptomyces sp. NPDC047017 TaxID=3155024 RepID=UPI0033F063E1
MMFLRSRCGQEARRQVFSVDVRPVGAATVLGLRGELDFDSAVQLHEAADAVLVQRPVTKLVVVDCASLEFCDSSGIGALVRVHQRLSGADGLLRLAAVPASVARVFTLTGLHQVIAMHATTQEALAAGWGGHDSLAGDRAGSDAVEGWER